MIKKTDLSAIKEIANAFLLLEPQGTDYSPAFIHHPFTNTGFAGIKDSNGKIKILNIWDNEEYLNAWRSEVKKTIDNCEDAESIFVLLNKNYSLGFVKYIFPYLSQEDAAKLLRNAWINSEHPNTDATASLSKCIYMFKKATRNYLMVNSEKAFFDKLPDEITIYRGIGSLSAKPHKALSWTNSFDEALWFANRFERNGCVYRATVHKSDILAFFEQEQEVIVPPSALQNLEKTVNISKL